MASTYTYSAIAYPRSFFLYDPVQHLYRPSNVSPDSNEPVVLGSSATSQTVANWLGSYMHKNFVNLAKSAVDNTARIVTLENFSQLAGSSSPGYITYTGLQDAPGSFWGGSNYFYTASITQTPSGSNLAIIIGPSNSYGFRLAVGRGINYNKALSSHVDTYLGKELSVATTFTGLSGSGYSGANIATQSVTSLYGYIGSRLVGYGYVPNSSSFSFPPTSATPLASTSITYPLYATASNGHFKIPYNIAGTQSLSSFVVGTQSYSFYLYLDDYESFQNATGATVSAPITVSFTVTTGNTASYVVAAINNAIATGITTFNATWNTNYNTTCVTAIVDGVYVTFVGNNNFTSTGNAINTTPTTSQRLTTSTGKGIYRFTVKEITANGPLYLLGIVATSTGTSPGNYAFAYDYGQVVQPSGGTYAYTISSVSSPTSFVLATAGGSTTYTFTNPSAITSATLLAQAIANNAVTPSLPQGFTFTSSGTTLYINFVGIDYQNGNFASQNFDPTITVGSITGTGFTATLSTVQLQLIGIDPYVNFNIVDGTIGGTAVGNFFTTYFTTSFSTIYTVGNPLQAVHSRLPYTSPGSGGNFNAPSGYIVPSLNIEANLAVSSLTVRGNLNVLGNIVANNLTTGNSLQLAGASLSNDTLLGINTPTLGASTSVPTQLAVKTFVATNYSGIKNLLPNGSFDVWQRGFNITATASVDTYSYVFAGGSLSFSPTFSTTKYLADRWTTIGTAPTGATSTAVYNANTSGTFTITQGNTSNYAGSVPPLTTTNWMRVSYGSVGGMTFPLATALPSEYVTKVAGSTVSLQVQLRANTAGSWTGNFTVNIDTNTTANVAFTGAWTQIATVSQSITSLNATTWTTVKLQGVAIPAGTLGLRVRITDVASTTSSNYYEVGAVQLELNPYCTSLEVIPYAVELERCQRYFYSLAPISTSSWLGIGYTSAATTGVYMVNLPVTMRTTPSLVVGNPASFSNFLLTTGALVAASAISISSSNTQTALLNATIASTTANLASALVTNATNAILWFNSEI